MVHINTPTVTFHPVGLAGRLLIATPQLMDGPFAQSVVLICAHDREHAYGLILNKLIEGVAAQDAIPDLRLSPAHIGQSAPLHFGGPCDTRRGAVLHSAEFKNPDTLFVPGGLAVTTTRDALVRLMGDQVRPQRSLLFAGHAGWSAGQLDDELRQHAWLDIPATPAFVFDTPPEGMWAAALAKLGITPSSLSALGADRAAGSRPLH